MSTPLEALRAALDGAVAAVADGGAPRAAPTLERPRQAEHGDYATNAALMIAKAVGEPPREVAARLAQELAAALGPALAACEVAGPGFLNLVLSEAWYAEALGAIAEAGERWGAGGADPVRQVNVEFVSANPTGPVHIGGTRNAAYGDALARLLEFRGHRVHREFYVNDAGSQISLLGASIQARARGEQPPEGGYIGDYIGDLAAEIDGAAGLPVDEVARLGVELMIGQAERSLARFRIVFDTWFREHTLHDGSPTAVERAFAVLDAQGRTFRREGALWLRTTEFGDDKDRVLERSSGEHTYFASDIAYHQEKRERGFDLLIDIWGADHHGYVPRMHAAYRALGGGEGELELIIMQLVHLVEGGERARMSKRAGEFVTLDDLVDDIGVDAARWFLLARSHDTTMELDLELARSQSNENPVYYVQYAHARIASILRRAAQEGMQPPPLDARRELHPSERALVQRLLEFPDEVAEAADKRAPHRIAAYALDTARAFSAFYRDCQVLGVAPADLGFRLRLCAATRQVLARALDLLGVAAPDEM
ncbi:MAG TPA: arginine--tRNA ligase [Solirubrobacteraceae bacterium]|nr:arginine--tRNA ligase [Solirubrobacteraceae bacterium]